MSTPGSIRKRGYLGEASGSCGDAREQKSRQDVRYGAGEEQEMWAAGGLWVRSDVMSGRNRRWEWRQDAGDAEDGKTTSDASGRSARALHAGLIFADECGGWFPCQCSYGS